MRRGIVIRSLAICALSLGAAVWLSAHGGGTALADTLTIDDFTHPPLPGEFFTVFDAGANPRYESQTGPLDHILGGSRDIFMEVDGTPRTGSLLVFTGEDYSVPPRTLYAMVTGGMAGAKSKLTYDGTPESPLLVDLTNGTGAGKFVLQFDKSDGGDSPVLDVGVVVTGQSGTATLPQPALVPDSTDPFEFEIPFSSFTVSGASPFTNATKLEFLFNYDNTPNVDFKLFLLSSVTNGGPEVPEPSTAVIGAVAVLTMLTVRGGRRRMRRGTE
jgi:hypothetical protein